MSNNNLPICARAAFVGIVLFAVCALLFVVFCLCTKKLQKHLDDDCDRKCVYLLKKDFIYISVIAGMVIVVLLTLTLANNENAVNYFSFAGTLSSIILSVVAIFMTINSENESKDAKIQLDISVSKLENTSKEITHLAEEWQASAQNLQNRLEKLYNQYQTIEEKMDRVLTIDYGHSLRPNQWDQNGPTKWGEKGTDENGN